MSFGRLYDALRVNGVEASPRGQRTKEILNFGYAVRPDCRFVSFPSKELNLKYIREEFKWYLRGDPYDLSICQHAKIWESCVTDGRINSNYGQYIFSGSGIDYVVNVLKNDPDSRRAVITILGKEHLYEGNRDVPCTCTMGFMIRNNHLHCSVHMRSQDAVFGMRNDVPFFGLVQDLVAALLEIKFGMLHVAVDSFHVYERHFDFLEQVKDEAEEIHAVPHVRTREEALNLVHNAFSMDFPFTRWLYAS